MRCAGPSTPRPFALRWASRGGTPAAGNPWSRRLPSRPSSPPRSSRHREGGTMTADNHDPFALARSGGSEADAELCDLIAEHSRLWQLGTEFCDTEKGEAYDAATRPFRDQIRVTKPSTLAEAIAQLELAAEWDDPDMVRTA